MRRLCGIILMALLIPAVSQGAGYVVGTYGLGGEMGEPSAGLEIGAIFLSDLHPTGGAFSLGIGISIGGTDESPPSTYPPTSPISIRTLVEYNDGNEQAVCLCAGTELTPGLFAIGGLGYATQNVVTIAYAPDGWYQVDSEDDTYVPWLVGIRYAVEGLVMGLGVRVWPLT